jgi:hypothetical protein
VNVEKLYKLTLGLIALDVDKQWPEGLLLVQARERPLLTLSANRALRDPAFASQAVRRWCLREAAP